MARPGQVQMFLDALSVVESQRNNFRSAPWLKSPFDAYVWSIMTTRVTTIDFRVTLPNGTVLTDPQNLTLLSSLKTFLIIQTHPENTSGVVYSAVTAAQRILYGIHVCERLLQTSSFDLGKFRLTAISDSEAKNMLRELSASAVSESVYGWSEKIAKFLLQKGSKITDEELREYQHGRSFLKAVPGVESELGLSLIELEKARVWLWENSYYKKSAYESGFVYTLDSNKLAELLYPRGTLTNTWKKPHLEELHLLDGPRLIAEKSRVPVRGDRRTEHPSRSYSRAFKSMRLLDRARLEVPQALVDAADDKVFVQSLALADAGRYQTVPFELVLASIRNAIEFSLSYGSDLLDAYVRIANAARGVGKPVSTFLREHGLDSFLSPSLTGLGVTCWSIVAPAKKAYARGKGISIADLESNFFNSLRRNEGLYELLEIFGGCILVLVGAVMACRQGELIDLECGDLFNDARNNLLLRARKTGAAGLRGERQQPIPAIGVDLLEKIEIFQQRLVALELIPSLTQVFAFPRQFKVGLGTASETTCNRMLDRFCDYFQTSLDAKGRRFYLRQHQLRRFFAMMFFWGKSFGGLETLRLFLGQTDPAHVYNYITETVPGAVLQNVKADFAINRLRDDDPAALPLLELIEQQFNTRNITLIEDVELVPFIETMMQEGLMSVEPHFFRLPNGSDYEIVISVKEGAQAHG